jgi:hypothetical protein
LSNREANDQLLPREERPIEGCRQTLRIHRPKN